MVFRALIFGFFMATRWYLPSDTLATPISPTPSTDWETTSILTRTTAPTVRRNSVVTEVSFTDANAADRDILFKQFVGQELTAGQTITGAQAIKGQIRGRQKTLTQNMKLTLGIRIIASDGTTVRKIVLAVTRDDIELAVSSVNRQFTATSVAGNYTTVAGDYPVFEVGTGGDPDVGTDHDTFMTFNDDNASDLPENDTATAELNPWIELADTLTFVSGFNPTTTVGSQNAAKRGGIGIRQMRRRDSGLYVPAYLKMAA